MTTPLGILLDLWPKLKASDQEFIVELARCMTRCMTCKTAIPDRDCGYCINCGKKIL